MGAKTVKLKVPQAIPIANVDVEFEVRDGSELMGRLKISKGGLDWKPVNKHTAYSVTWKKFADWIAD